MPLLTASMPQMLNYMSNSPLPPKSRMTSSPMPPGDAARQADARDAAAAAAAARDRDVRERDAAARERELREYDAARMRPEMMQQAGLLPPGWPQQRLDRPRQASPHPPPPSHAKLGQQGSGHPPPPRGNVIVEMSRSHSPRQTETSARFSGAPGADKGSSREAHARAASSHIAMTPEHFQKLEQENFLNRQSELRSNRPPPQSGRMSSNSMARTAEKFLKNMPLPPPPPPSSRAPPHQDMRNMAMADMMRFPNQPPPQPVSTPMSVRPVSTPTACLTGKHPNHLLDR